MLAEVVKSSKIMSSVHVANLKLDRASRKAASRNWDMEGQRRKSPESGEASKFTDVTICMSERTNYKVISLQDASFAPRIQRKTYA